MTNPLAQDLGGVVRLFHETSGDTWAARGARVVSDPEFPVLRGHIADCVEDDDAAFIAACHEFFRTHSAEIAGALRDAEGWRPIESAPRDGTWIDVWGIPLNGTPAGRFTDVQWFAGCFRFPSYSSAPGQYGQAVPADITHWRPLPAPPTQDYAMQQGGGGGSYNLDMGICHD